MVGAGSPVTEARRVIGFPSVTWLSVNSWEKRGATVGASGSDGGASSGTAVNQCE